MSLDGNVVRPLFGLARWPESMRSERPFCRRVSHFQPIHCLPGQTRPIKWAILCFDPDPAIVRSGLLDVMADRNQLLRLIRRRLPTADFVPTTTFVTAFEIETVLPNNLKYLKNIFAIVRLNTTKSMPPISTQADAVYANCQPAMSRRG